MKSRDILTEKDPMKETEMMMDYALEQLGVVIDKN